MHANVTRKPWPEVGRCQMGCFKLLIRSDNPQLKISYEWAFDARKKSHTHGELMFEVAELEHLSCHNSFDSLHVHSLMD